MAIFHLSCSSIGNKTGRHVTAAAAYRASCVIVDRTTGERHDYTRKRGTLKAFMLLPENAPAWASDRAEFWNRVQERENHSNSEFCKSFDIALPKELTESQREALVTDWVKRNYISLGLVADVAIHAPHRNKDGSLNDNWHAHVLLSTRGVNADGWEAKKEASINGRDRNKILTNARKDWADIVNAEFEKLGIATRIDHRSLEEQGIDRQPQQHMGVTATAMARKGKATRRGRYAETRKLPKKVMREYLAIDAEAAKKELAEANAELAKIKKEMEAMSQPAPAPVQKTVPATQPKPTQTVAKPAVTSNRRTLIDANPMLFAFMSESETAQKTAPATQPKPTQTVAKPAVAQKPAVAPTAQKTAPATQPKPTQTVAKPAVAQKPAVAPVSKFAGLTAKEINGLNEENLEMAETIYLKYKRFGGRDEISKLLQESRNDKAGEIQTVIGTLKEAEKRTGARANWLKAVKYIEGWANYLPVVAKALRAGAKATIEEYKKLSHQTHEDARQSVQSRNRDKGHGGYSD